jgi:transposase
VANYLEMPKIQQVIGLLALNWTFRRIERETGVRRETVARYARMAAANAAKVFPGSEGAGSGEDDGKAGESGDVLARVGSNPAKVFPGSRAESRSAAAAYREVILEKLAAGLTIQRVFQDLQEEYGYGCSYESVKRYVRGLDMPKRLVGVMHTLPGEEAQVDFFQGAPTLDPTTGRWRRPWVFRMTLCHSRHGYEEAVWSQKLGTFLRLHENAFRDFGGVPLVVRHDNLKSAVVRACLYDPDVHAIYAAFSKHWGFTGLPIRPSNPKENGKQERSGGYVKSNALKGRRFDSLAAQNEHLRHWNRTIARLRIHGTTRRQVYTHFVETDQKALLPLAAESFAIFECGTRRVHDDGFIEVAGSFYPAPVHLVGLDVQARWDGRLVRIFHGEEMVGVHARVAAGTFAPRQGESTEPTSSQRACVARLLGRCSRVGRELHEWAEAAYVERGVRAFRLIQGALSLVRKHPKEVVLHAAKRALAHRLFRYKDLRRLAEQADSVPDQRSLLDVHDVIRPMNEYRLETL